MKIPPKRFIFGWIILFFTSLAIWAFLIEPNHLIVKQHTLKLKKWSPKLNGIKIVAISDVHAGSNFIDEEKLHRIVSLSNQQDADLIIFLGDYLSAEYFDRKKLKMPLETAVQNLSGMRAKYGVFAVLGNHDNEYGNEKVKAEFENAGYRVLENEAISIEKNGEKIRFVGLADVLKTGNPLNYSEDAKSALDKLGETEGNIIAFTHNPDMVEFLTGDHLISKDFSLFLAGHTHGGQCNFPLIGSPIVPSSFGQKYAAGFIRKNDVDVFVATGIGTSILPVRFRVPPEISVLTLEAE